MNKELANAFGRIADLLEICGGDAFRSNSYRRVSRILKDLTDDIVSLNQAGTLAGIPGIGKSTAAKIVEYLDTGSIKALEELKSKLPPELPELLRIPGLGPKKIALFYRELNVGGFEDLEDAIESGALAALSGMGKKSAEKIKGGIAFLKSSVGRTPYGLALPIAEQLAEYLGKFEGVERIEIAGSLRRGCETIGDIDLLCACDDGEALIGYFLEHPSKRRVLASGSTKGSMTVEVRDNKEMQVDLRVVPKASFGAALQYFTGSLDHNVHLRGMAQKNGYKLNEWGLYQGEEQIAGSDEAEVYKQLGLKFIPPEVREDRGEFDSDVAFDELIVADNIRGDLHTHTTASDGSNSIAEMALAAKALGYEYIAISDHSRSSFIANGLSVERMWEHIEAIRKADNEIDGIKIFVACECDILTDATMDYPDDVLAACDLVVASIHAAMTLKKPSPTERTLAAIANPYVTIIGHPTGRLIHRRPAMDMDIAKIIEAALKHHTALEVNSSWQRMDLKDNHVRMAVEAGVSIAINTDAHSVDDLKRLHFGVKTARRGFVRKRDVINTLGLSQLTRWIQNSRADVSPT
ncbi:MAG: DNA polymerase/3'-5' exonuclease PolX [Planctomycetes bacterium]|nr:DNA polymerase/3'-5' exonuclease PolX [Planctomycetota bacterium]